MRSFNLRQQNDHEDLPSARMELDLHWLCRRGIARVSIRTSSQPRLICPRSVQNVRRWIQRFTALYTRERRLPSCLPEAAALAEVIHLRHMFLCDRHFARRGFEAEFADPMPWPMRIADEMSLAVDILGTETGLGIGRAIDGPSSPAGVESLNRSSSTRRNWAKRSLGMLPHIDGGWRQKSR